MWSTKYLSHGSTFLKAGYYAHVKLLPLPKAPPPESQHIQEMLAAPLHVLPVLCSFIKNIQLQFQDSRKEQPHWGGDGLKEKSLGESGSEADMFQMSGNYQQKQEILFSMVCSNTFNYTSFLSGVFPSLKHVQQWPSALPLAFTWRLVASVRVSDLLLLLVIITPNAHFKFDWNSCYSQHSHSPFSNLFWPSPAAVAQP